MNTQKLNSAIAEFTKKKKSNAAYYEENWAERKERKEYYQSFTKDKLLAMTEEEFLEYISKLWSMLIWGNKKYVFEVQSKGSIDSLILNLKKAQSNAAVQAVVAVADEEQLAKIIRESAGVIDEKSLRTWDSEDVLAVYDSLVRAHESINKLALVPESF